MTTLNLISSQNVAIHEQTTRRMLKNSRLKEWGTKMTTKGPPKKDKPEGQYLHSNIAVLLSLHGMEFGHQRIHRMLWSL
jgi:hypothetical protein